MTDNFANEIHIFKIFGNNYCYDVNSRIVHEIHNEEFARENWLRKIGLI